MKSSSNRIGDLGTIHDIRVANPDFVGGTGSFAEQGTAQIQSWWPSVASRPSAATPRSHAGSLHCSSCRRASMLESRRGCLQLVLTGRGDFADHIDEGWGSLRQRNGRVDAGSDLGVVASFDLAFQFFDRQPVCLCRGDAGSWIVPSGVTVTRRNCPPCPKRASIAERNASSRAFVFRGVTVIDGTL
jgi:hypothetical protein